MKRVFISILIFLSIIAIPAVHAESLFTLGATQNYQGVPRSLFGEKSQYLDTFKSIVYQQMGHDMASNPRSSIGMAEQIYRQMEKYTK